jgi:hypothetical protein
MTGILLVQPQSDYKCHRRWSEIECINQRHDKSCHQNADTKARRFGTPANENVSTVDFLPPLLYIPATLIRFRDCTFEGDSSSDKERLRVL